MCYGISISVVILSDFITYAIYHKLIHDMLNKLNKVDRICTNRSNKRAEEKGRMSFTQEFYSNQ